MEGKTDSLKLFLDRIYRIYMILFFIFSFQVYRAILSGEVLTKTETLATAG